MRGELNTKQKSLLKHLKFIRCETETSRREEYDNKALSKRIKLRLEAKQALAELHYNNIKDGLKVQPGVIKELKKLTKLPLYVNDNVTYAVYSFKGLEIKVTADKQFIRTDYRHLISSIQEARHKSRLIDRKEMYFETKQNYTLYYTLEGGVHTVPNQFGKVKMERKLDKLDEIKTPPQLEGLGDYIGVEIEFLSPYNEDKIKEMLCLASLENITKVNYDSSVHGGDDESTEDYNGCEVVVLTTKQNLRQDINAVCKVLKKAKAVVNDTCGLHVHLDARNNTQIQKYRNIIKNLPFLYQMLPQSRRNNTKYCRMNTTTRWRLASRYYAVNSQAFSKYKTIEVRCHSGTVNADKICNWVEILYTIADHKLYRKKFNDAEEMALYFGFRDELTLYMLSRIKLFNDKLQRPLTTTYEDHELTPYAIAA